MFWNRKKEIEELNRRFDRLNKMVLKSEYDIEYTSRDVAWLKCKLEEETRLLHCHDCDKYPAVDEFTRAFCHICERGEFKLKLVDYPNTQKKTCLDDLDLFKKV